MYENEKKNAAIEALKYVHSNMKIGIGTGSTTKYFIDGLGELVRSGKITGITGVPTSLRSADLASSYGIKIDNNLDGIEIDFDGADEFDINGNLVKGGGGALVREKIVAYNSRDVYIMADHSKFSEKLHTFPLPVEVIPFMEDATKKNIEKLGCTATFRDRKKFKSDNGNYILDCKFNITDVSLEKEIKMIPGVVEVGLFKGIATKIIIGENNQSKITDFKKL
ncbi:ribose-5-phosphate isomerase RpiA [Ferroplasma sp.]|uniref:ribose-5-phosphate isomerase RpiA n=1 Tax=Ferroplasma sp. TaxID=2591003 RepID=UPI00307E60A4